MIDVSRFTLTHPLVQLKCCHPFTVDFFVDNKSAVPAKVTTGVPIVKGTVVVVAEEDRKCKHVKAFAYTVMKVRPAFVFVIKNKKEEYHIDTPSIHESCSYWLIGKL